MIRMIEDVKIKSTICLKVLRDLPEWFGIESSLLNYVKEVESCVFIAYEDIGFIALKEHPNSFDMHVLGVLKDHHGKGIGRSLTDYAEAYARSHNKKYMTVKTLSADHPDLNYKKTREFYERMGYEHLEVFKTLWDENNPCLYMIKCL
ncbi:GNAT family N-acetyltransferase [Acidaminobacter sp. JC074]|uniref:GNAT family N-acetyltransferase n=1 Tax=Acidaminobacter sp. JC074 TaxID=2530199 RepID=UPI001F0DF56C|nr:GNAT family N-acetyltransferase [Acidaminobacter sp. JC074]MCH4887980.1 GNAT family N-acetyltransferase [Acidaminobacter sp. JC074]